MKISTLIPAIALSLLAPSTLHAETPAEKEARMQWFHDARFGMFIHWGLYSEAAGEWNGKPVADIGEWIQSYGKIPHAEYRSVLLPRFNPVKYDADAWVLAAKNAGMKYIVITSKHHDGFALWDSKLTDWDIASTPYKKDLLKPLAEACEKYGVRLCLYHSIMDWGHPDWGTKASGPPGAATTDVNVQQHTWRANYTNPKPDMDKYTAYLKGQLKELVDNYHPGILWFDGEWEDAWTHERGVDLYEYLRKADPALIINNRVDKGRAGLAGHTTDAKFKGDYGTPEQEIPATGFEKGVAWESCMTMNDTWGFKKNDHNWKSPEVLIRNLVDIASKGGNYLLNVGPTGEGEIPAPSLERLAAMGAWMKVNGESIHNTTATLFETCSWDGRSTTRTSDSGATRVYLHVFNRPESGKLVIKGLLEKPEKATLLGSSEPLTASLDAGACTIDLPATLPDPICSVIALDFKKSPAIKQIPAPPAPEKKEPAKH